MRARQELKDTLGRSCPALLCGSKEVDIDAILGKLKDTQRFGKILTHSSLSAMTALHLAQSSTAAHKPRAPSKEDPRQ